MLHIAGHQGNANQSQRGMPLHIPKDTAGGNAKQHKPALQKGLFTCDLGILLDTHP